MPATYCVRPEQPGDEDAIDDVLREAFPSPGEANLVRALRRGGKLQISLVALAGENIVGHIAFSPVTLRGQPLGLGLAPVAVRPAAQRQGIGAALVRAGLSACRAADCPSVVVLGEPEYYGRFGFAPASRWNLSDEYGGGEAFQAIVFDTAVVPIGGTVQYAAEFADL